MSTPGSMICGPELSVKFWSGLMLPTLAVLVLVQVKSPLETGPAPVAIKRPFTASCPMSVAPGAVMALVP